MPELEQEKLNENNEVENNEEEQKKLDESLDTVNLDNPETAESFEEKIEKSRSEFFKVYNKQRKTSTILMPVAGLLMAGSFILFIAIGQLWGKITGGVVLGATLVGMIVYFFLTKNILPNKSKEYIRNFVLTSDNYVFDFNEVKNSRVQLKRRFAGADFLPDRVYKDIIDLASRNIVELEYKNHHVTVGEVALYKRGNKKGQRAILFVGKYLSFVNDYHFEDRYIISINSEKNIDLPNDVEDLVILKEQNNFKVYGKEGANIDKDLPKDLLNELMGIECSGSLLNVNIVLWAGHTAIYLSYDDSIVAIPLDKKLDVNAYKLLKQNIKDLLEILVN